MDAISQPRALLYLAPATGPLGLFLGSADRGPWTTAPLSSGASLRESAFTQFSPAAEHFLLSYYQIDRSLLRGVVDPAFIRTGV